MATQAINNVVNVALDTIADFTAAGPSGPTQPGIDDTKLSDGWRCWVRDITGPGTVGINHGLWFLDKESLAVVNNVTVCATFSGVGRYVFFGAGLPAGSGGITHEVRFVIDSNVNVAAFPFVAYDGVVPVAGNRFLAVGQTLAQQNGVWVVPALPGQPCTRPIDWQTGSVIAACLCQASEGTDYADSLWILTTNGPIVVDTTPVAFEEIDEAPAGGIGNTLHVTAAGRVGWGPLNLAGGANYVSGLLPIANGGTGVASLGTNAYTATDGAGNVLPVVGGPNAFATTNAAGLPNATTPAAAAIVNTNGAGVIGSAVPGVKAYVVTDAAGLVSAPGNIPGPGAFATTDVAGTPDSLTGAANSLVIKDPANIPATVAPGAAAVVTTNLAGVIGGTTLGASKTVVTGPTGLLAGIDFSFVNEAALTAAATTDMREGEEVFVQSHSSYWQLITSTLALSANKVIASTTPAKRWIRQVDKTSLKNTEQFTWFVGDLATGGGFVNNEFDGASRTTAITVSELCLRVRVWSAGFNGTPQRYIINMINDNPGGTNVGNDYFPTGSILSDGNQISATLGNFGPTMIGFRRTIISGTLTADASVAGPNANTKATMIDTAADFSAVVDRMVCVADAAVAASSSGVTGSITALSGFGANLLATFVGTLIFTPGSVNRLITISGATGANNGTFPIVESTTSGTTTTIKYSNPAAFVEATGTISWVEKPAKIAHVISASGFKTGTGITFAAAVGTSQAITVTGAFPTGFLAATSIGKRVRITGSADPSNNSAPNVTTGTLTSYAAPVAATGNQTIVVTGVLPFPFLATDVGKVIRSSGSSATNNGDFIITGFNGATSVDILNPAGRPLPALGNAVASLAFAAGVVTLTAVGAGFTADSVGSSITITAATNPANIGTFTITAFVSATSVRYANALGATQAAATVAWTSSGSILGVDAGFTLLTTAAGPGGTTATIYKPASTGGVDVAPAAVIQAMVEVGPTWYSQATLLPTTAPLFGSPYCVVSFATYSGRVTTQGGPRTMVYSWTDCDINGGGSQGASYSGFTIFNTCRVAAGITPSAGVISNQSTMITNVCCYRSSTPFTTVGLQENAYFRPQDTAFVNINLRVREAVQFVALNDVFQAGCLSIGSTNESGPRAASIVFSATAIGIFNNTSGAAANPPTDQFSNSSGAALILGRGCRVATSGALNPWGVGATIGVHIKEGADWMISQISIPSLTNVSGTQQIKIDGTVGAPSPTGVVIPSVDPATGLPVASNVPITITTWATLNAAPYAGNAVNYEKLTKFTRIVGS